MTILAVALFLLGATGAELVRRGTATAPGALWRDAGLLLASWGALLEAAVLVLTHPGDGARGPLTAAALGVLGAGAVALWWPHTKP